MKKTLVTLTTALFALSATAQELPVPSPLGEVEQKVGLTEVEIEYSRPSAKGRTIFGELVKYDEMWRLGANMATKLEISTPITLGGKEIAKGEYSMQAIPAENGDWTIIINSDAGLRGLSGYDEKKDVVRLTAKAMVNSYTETFTMGFDKITATSAVIAIEWEKLRVEVPFTVDTDKIAKANIEAAIKEGKDLDKVYASAASYFSNMEDYKTALMYADKSLGVKKTHQAMFTKAGILKANGDIKGAIKAGKEALELANQAESKGWANYIEGNIKAWEKE
jgi:tetratricopeptide (TPR) repeat protein